MTLIATVFDEMGGFIAVSDILISNNSLAPGDRDILPLQFGIAPQLSATIGRGIRSKSLIFDNYLLLWTGSVFGADRLIQAVMANPPTSAGEFYELASQIQDDVIEELTGKGRQRSEALFSAILCWNDGRKFWLDQFNAPAQYVKGASIRVGGTGADDFVSALKQATEIGRLPIGEALMQSVFKLILRELTDKAHKYDVYGGGYEFIRFCEDGGFCKIPYSLCEISFYDHLSFQRLNDAYISRVIQCQPHPNGCFFITCVLPHSGSHLQEERKLFWANSHHTRTSKIPMFHALTEPEFGMALVIDNVSQFNSSLKPFAKLVTRNGPVVYDMNAVEQCIKRYIHWRKSIQTTPARSFNCDGCAKKFDELNYIPLLDEYEIQTGEKLLCDDCLAKYQQGSPS